MKTLVIILLILLSAVCMSQDILNPDYGKCSYLRSAYLRIQEEEGNYSAGHSFDVLNYKLNFDLYNCFKTPFPTSYKGSTVVIFKADSSINLMKLNAASAALIIDSVRYSGISFFQQNDILYINLNRIHNPGETDSVKIYFRRNNIIDYSLQNFSNSGRVFFTFLEPEGARLIFPCWDRQQDKAFFDFTVKVPGNVLLGSNGILKDTIRSGDSLFFHWESMNPMATYLFSMIGQIDYRLNVSYYHKPNNDNDSIPVMLYYNSIEQPGFGFLTSLKQMTDFFSQKFTAYPFEKIGFANTEPISFNMMENQTLTTMMGSWGSPNPHEHGHQWFGDYITCKTWADMWLNEGFGSYMTAFYDEYINGPIRYFFWIRYFNNFYIANNGGFPIYNPSWAIHTPSNDSLFSPIEYDKAACVIHTFRKTIGDTLFMQFLKAYMNDTNFAYKTASTNDFIQKVNQITGQDYTWFFDEWLSAPNHPIYANTMNVVDSGSLGWKLYFNISQVQTNSPFHRMPVKLKINYSDNTDSNALVQNTYNNQTFTFTSARRPVGVYFDYDFSIAPKQANDLIGVNSNNEIPKYFNLYQNFPNPFNASTFITYTIPVSTNIILKVYDITGRLVATPVNESKLPGEYKVNFDGNNISSGVYFYRLEAGNYVNVKKMILVK